MKAELFFWLAFSNKVPTWDILQKRTRQGPSICMLYREHEENIVHLIVGCHFTKEVWAASFTLLKGAGKWKGDSLSEAFKAWFKEQEVCEYRVFPIAVSWAIWCSKNEIIFQNASFTPEQVFYKVQLCFEEHRDIMKEKPQHQIGSLVIDESHP